MLDIENLHVKVAGKTIIDGLSLKVAAGQVAAIMGPNGSGKSTLSYVIAGKADYEVTEGTIKLDGVDLLDKDVSERAALGVFLSFQYPLEIPGVATMTFLKAAINAQRKARDEDELSIPDFMKRVRAAAAKLNISQDMLKRPVNLGFSGGEKKRMEILQMALLEPRFAILDEMDFRPRHRRPACLRRGRQRAALQGSRPARDHPLPAAARLYRARRRACHVEGKDRQKRRPRTGAGAGKKRLCRLCERGGLMGAPLLNPTQAEQDFSQAFALARPGFLDAADRQKAFERFSRAGLPTRRVESWHYSDLRAKLRAAPALAGKPDDASKAFARSELEKLSARETLKLVLIDGYFSQELSDDFSSVAGVKIRALSSLSPDERVVGQMRDLAPADPLLDLNAAFARDGVVVEIAEGTRLARPIEIIALCGCVGGQSRFSRNFVSLGAGARASVIETRAEGSGGFGDSALFLSLGQAAELDYACRAENSAAVDVQNLVVRMDAEAKLRATSLISAAPFLRRQIFATCAGEGVELQLSGASLLKSKEHADVTLVVTHEAPACISRETYKYVLAGESEGVFQGKIVVPPEAQKTDGKMLCRALLLSDSASMSVKPELEIFADDVACGHGAACAKLDAAQLFYMELRGIPKMQAQGILIEAFAAETFDILSDNILRDLLNSDLIALLESGIFA